MHSEEPELQCVTDAGHLIILVGPEMAEEGLWAGAWELRAERHIPLTVISSLSVFSSSLRFSLSSLSPLLFVCSVSYRTYTALRFALLSNFLL